MKMRILTTLLVVGIAAGITLQTQAAEYRFNNDGGDNTWTNSANWQDSDATGIPGPPGPSDIARFQSNNECNLDTVTAIGNLNMRGHSTPGASVVNINDGGALTSNASADMGGDNRIGAGVGLSTTLNINSNATVTLNGTGEFEMGGDAQATGTVNIATGGSLIVNHKLVAGKKADGVAIINVNGGTATFTVDAQIGSSADSYGYVTLNSGTLISEGNFRLTDNTTGYAELRVNGGVLIATNSSVQIRDAAGLITQTGGVINTDDLYVGHLPTSNGTMDMSGGSNTISGELVVGNQEKDGSASTGTLNMTGGWMFANTLSVGGETNTAGTLNLSGTNTYLKTSHLILGDSVSNGQVNASSTINAADGLFQIHDITADANSTNESFVLSGAVLKLRHLSTSNIVEKMEALIDGGVLTWTNGAIGSMASTFDRADADFSWTNEVGTLLYADTNGTHYTYMWAQAAQNYSGWASDYGMTNNNAYLDNYDGDTLDNLMEFGLGGDPTNGFVEAGVLPVTGTAGDWFVYVYNRRTDAASRNLTYDVLNKNNLGIPGGWLNEYELEIGISAPFAGTLGDAFESVTNRISMTGQPEEFTKLEITISE